MFQKLKIKLILINVVALTLVLMLIFMALYFFMKQGLEQQSYMMMNTIAKEERVLPPIGAPDANRALSGSFFIKVNTLGEILENSSENGVSQDDLEKLKKIALKKEINTGNIESNNYKLKFLKVQKSYGEIIVFSDRSMEDNIFKWMIIASICIGLVSLGLVFFISMFLASKAIKPIKASWEKQNAFVADASHELRTPLAVVNSNLEIVMENENETVGSQNKWLSNVQGELERMKKLVDDLLFLARADSEGEEMTKEIIDLSGLLWKIYDLFTPLAQKKGLQLILQNKDNIAVLGNEYRIKQLITILLDNAIKHTSIGGNIELRLEADINNLQLSIRDTGEGIPKEYLKKIFDRFYRVDKSRSRSQGGSGLGLAIAKCIVDEHRGTINVASEIGKGTEFKIVLPIENMK
jgi:signal transduction histidine kinase